MKTIWFLFTAPVLFLLHPSSAFSQTDPADKSPSFGWATLGVGYAGNRQLGGFGGGLNASFLSTAGLFSLRILGAGNSNIRPMAMNGTEFEQFYEVSGMYGVTYRLLPLAFSASAGLGAVWIMEKTRVGRTTVKAVGLPLEIQLTVVPLRVFGIGVQLLGNLNSKSSYGGAFLCIQLGKLR